MSSRNLAFIYHIKTVCTTYRVVPLHVDLVDVPDSEVALVDLEADGVLALALLLPLHQRDYHRAASLVVVGVRILKDKAEMISFLSYIDTNKVC